MSERVERDFIAVKFSGERDGRGWHILDREGISPLHVVGVNNRTEMVYVFSTSNWVGIQEKLIEEGIMHAFLKGNVILFRDEKSFQEALGVVIENGEIDLETILLEKGIDFEVKQKG